MYVKHANCCRHCTQARHTCAQKTILLELPQSAVLVADLFAAVVDLLASDPIELSLKESHVEAPSVEADAVAAAALTAEAVHEGEFIIGE